LVAEAKLKAEAAAYKAATKAVVAAKAKCLAELGEDRSPEAKAVKAAIKFNSGAAVLAIKELAAPY
jgi:hypothetical protein